MTELAVGRVIMRGLHGHRTGFSVPQYVLTTPLGKIPLTEEYIHLLRPTVDEITCHGVVYLVSDDLDQLVRDCQEIRVLAASGRLFDLDPEEPAASSSPRCS